MKIKYIKSIMLVSLMVIFGFSSCLGDLDVEPIDPSVTQEFKQDEVFVKIYATLGLTGQEGPAGNGDVSGIDEGFSAFYRLIFTANEYPSDEVICSWSDTGIPDFYSISWGSSNSTIQGLYGRLYFDITLCNHFLEQTEGMGDEKTIRQRAEVRFMRALNYYYLLDFFGSVAFTETVSTTNPEQISRADLYKYVESELLACESEMFEPRQAPYGRADKAANWLLMARLYLNAQVYTGTAQWANAATYAKKVIDSGYTLSPQYSHLFMADNDGSGTVNKAIQEIILPISQDGIYTKSYGGSLYLIGATHTEGMTYWGTTEGWGGVRARKALVDKFFPSGNAPLSANETQMAAAAVDDRALFFAGGDRTLEITNVNTFKEGFSIAKWSNVRADGKTTSHALWTDTDIPFLRLGEAYLIYAEALLRSGGSSSDALGAINTLRTRANAVALATVDLNGVLDERARELYCEGHRRTDLIRYGYFTTASYTWDWKGGVAQGTSVSSFYNLYPIPSSDLNANSNLTQNPGY